MIPKPKSQAKGINPTMRIIRTEENNPDGDTLLHVDHESYILTFSRDALRLSTVSNDKVLVGSYIGEYDVKHNIYSGSAYHNCLMQFLIDSLFLSIQDQQDMNINHEDDAKHWPLWTL